MSAGFLSHFEPVDLDRDLELGAEPAEFVDGAGKHYASAVTIPTPGTIAIEFAKQREAPHRGDYTLHLAYATHALAPSGADNVARWSLPRWPNRLANVEIRLLAARGMRPHAIADVLGADTIEIEEHGLQVEMIFRRVELPRTQTFAIGFEPPTMAAHASSMNTFVAPPPSQLLALGLGLAIALLWSIKHRLCARAHAKGTPRPLLPRMAAQGWAGVLCAGAVALFDRFPIVAAIGGVLGSVLAVEVIDRELVAAMPQPSRFADGLDATTPLGFAVALASYAGLTLLYHRTDASIFCAAVLLLPIFFSCSRPAAISGRPSGPAVIHGRATDRTQLAFLRKSSITVSRSFNSRATTSGCGSKSTSADCSSS
ncbi:MAG TPA: hypothetical protein VHZ95_16570 [Polyangiales bacterium]|nr:hypothetical protein [Polyangiales bacterium]